MLLHCVTAENKSAAGRKQVRTSQIGRRILLSRSASTASRALACTRESCYFSLPKISSTFYYSGGHQPVPPRSNYTRCISFEGLSVLPTRILPMCTIFFSKKNCESTGCISFVSVLFAHFNLLFRKKN